MPAIDEYSASAVLIDMYFNATKLSHGTAFFWRTSAGLFLITNWHNLSGKNPETGQHLSNKNAEPNYIRVWWNHVDGLGDRRNEAHSVRDEEGRPRWLVHPHYRQRVDVVALPITPPSEAKPYPINEMASEKLKVSVGKDVFVLGYPYENPFGGFPVWKRGSIASEPHVIPDERPCIFVDTASRPGMSGSPVLLRSWGTAHLENDSTKMGNVVATRIVGVYSGRLVSANPIDAQLGMMWPIEFVEEIVTDGVRDN